MGISRSALEQRILPDILGKDNQLTALYVGGQRVPVGAGKYWYVDSNNGASTADGKTPATALTTIDAAIGKCTANQGDVVVVLPAHAENVTAATGINCDVAGISIVGLGQGADIPTISFTALAGSITVGAASVTLANLKLVANATDGITSGITIAAAGDNCTLDGIIMRDTASTKEFLVHVSVATTVADLTIQNCDFTSLTGGSATNSILFAGSTTYLRILNTLIFTDSTDSVIDHLVAAGVDVYIDGCTLYNEDDQTAGYVLDFHAGSTGIVTNCRMAYNKNNAEMTKGAAMWWIANHASNTIAEGGIVEPPITAGIP